MGKDTFDYIVNKQVYNVNGQAALANDLNFPHRLGVESRVAVDRHRHDLPTNPGK